MPNPKLPADPTSDADAQSAWDKLPKNAPSRQALPPMTGGTRWLWGLLLIALIVIIFGILQGQMG